MDEQEGRNRYLKYVDTLEEASGKSFEQLKTESLADRDFGARMDNHVKSLALQDNLDAQDLTRILASGPSIQALASTVPASELTNFLVSVTRDLYQRELQQSTLESLQPDDRLENLNAPNNIFTGDLYSVLQNTEQAVFSVVPLPLDEWKSSIQNGSLVSTATFAASGEAVAWFGNTFKGVIPALQSAENIVLDRIPFGHGIKKATQFLAPAATIGMGLGEHLAVVGPIVGVLHSGINAASQGLGNIVASSIEADYLAKHLPSSPELATGFASSVINSAKDAFYQTQSYSVRHIAHSLAQTAGGAAQATGNIVLPVAFLSATKQLSLTIATHVSEKGLAQFIAEVPKTTQAVIGRAQSFIESIPANVNMLKEQFMATDRFQSNEYYQIPENFGIENVTGLTPEKALNLDSNSLAFALVKAEGLRNQLNDVYRRSSDPNFSYLLDSLSHREIESEFRQTVDSIRQITQKLVQDGKLQVNPNGEVSVSTQDQQESLNPSQIDRPETTDPSKTASIAEPIDSGDSIFPKSDLEKGYESSALELLNTRLRVDPKYLQNTQINFNGETLLRLKGGSLDISKIDKEAHDMLQTAMNQANNLKGEVKISVGGTVIVHVKNGEILAGHGIVQTASRVEANTPSQVQYNELSQGVKADGFEKARQVAILAYNQSTPDNPVTQEAVREILKHNPDFAKMEDIDPSVNDRMLSQAESRAIQSQQPQQQSKQPSQEKEPAMA